MSRKRQEARREQRRQQHQRELAARKRTSQTSLATMAGVSDGAEQAMRDIVRAWEQIGRALTLQSHPIVPPPTHPAQRDEDPPLTFSECVIGYRAWIIDSIGQLRAITMTKQIWEPGINEARCRPRDEATEFAGFLWGSGSSRPSESHAAPARGCHCGLYGFNDFPKVDPRWGTVDGAGRLFVLGAIAAWGDLRVHGTGFRASHACPTALAFHDATEQRVRDTLERVACDYRIPLVHVDALHLEAERHGMPLPADARPPNVAHGERPAHA